MVIYFRRAGTLYESLPTSTCFIVLIKWRLWMWPNRTHPCDDRHLLILDGPVCVWTWNVSRLRTPGGSAWLASAEVRVCDGRSPPSALLRLLCCSQGNWGTEGQRDRQDEGWMCPATRREARLILTCGFHGSSGSFLPCGVKRARLSGP